MYPFSFLISEWIRSPAFCLYDYKKKICNKRTEEHTTSIELHRGKLRKIYGAKNIAILYAHFVRKKIANSEFNQDKWCGRSGERGAQIGRSHSPASVLAKEPKVERRKFPSRESRQFFAGNLPTNRQLSSTMYTTM